MPVILATWEAMIRRIKVCGQPMQGVPETPSQPTAGYSGTLPVAMVGIFFFSFLLGYIHCIVPFIVTISNRLTLYIG
jgi:hypothetical protein